MVSEILTRGFADSRRSSRNVGVGMPNGISDPGPPAPLDGHQPALRARPAGRFHSGPEHRHAVPSAGRQRLQGIDPPDELLGLAEISRPEPDESFDYNALVATGDGQA